MNPNPKKEKEKSATGNGGMIRVAECLYRRVANGVYYFKGQIDGTEHTQSLGTTNFARARKELDERRATLRRLDHTKGKMTLAELCEQFQKTFSHRAQETISQKNRIRDRILDDWPTGRSTPIGKIRPNDCHLWLAQYDFGISARNGHMGFLKKLFAMAVDNEWLEKSPAKDLQWTRRRDPERRTPDFEQFQKIIENIRAPKSNVHHDGSRVTVQNGAKDSADFLEAQGLLGLGQAELSNLKRQDVDLTRGQISVVRRKTGKRFVIPIYPQARALIEKVCEGKRHSDHIFSIGNAKKALAAACDRLGFPRFSQRSFRRMFITRAIERGVDVKVIADWQGHADGGKLILDTYSYVRSPHSRAMARLMSTEEPANVVRMPAQVVS